MVFGKRLIRLPAPSDTLGAQNRLRAGQPCRRRAARTRDARQAHQLPAPSLFYLSIRESLQLRERAADAPATQRRVRLPQPAGATSKHTTLLGAASQPPPRAPGARYNAGGTTYVPYKMKVGCTIVVHWRNHKQWTC